MQPKRCQIQHTDQWFLRMPRLGQSAMKSSWCVNVSPLANQPNKNQQVHLPSRLPGGRTSGVVGKTSEACWLVSYLGGHWMEDKWPLKKEEVVCYSGMVFFRPMVRFCHHLLLHLLDKMGLALNFLGSEFLKVVVLPCFRIFGATCQRLRQSFV